VFYACDSVGSHLLRGRGVCFYEMWSGIYLDLLCRYFFGPGVDVGDVHVRTLRKTTLATAKIPRPLPAVAAPPRPTWVSGRVVQHRGRQVARHRRRGPLTCAQLRGPPSASFRWANALKMAKTQPPGMGVNPGVTSI
jgi:hypothetical protein